MLSRLENNCRKRQRDGDSFRSPFYLQDIKVWCVSLPQLHDGYRETSHRATCTWLLYYTVHTNVQYPRHSCGHGFLLCIYLFISSLSLKCTPLLTEWWEVHSWASVSSLTVDLSGKTALSRVGQPIRLCCVSYNIVVLESMCWINQRFAVKRKVNLDKQQKQTVGRKSIVYMYTNELNQKEKAMQVLRTTEKRCFHSLQKSFAA